MQPSRPLGKHVWCCCRAPTQYQQKRSCGSCCQGCRHCAFSTSCVLSAMRFCTISRTTIPPGKPPRTYAVTNTILKTTLAFPVRVFSNCPESCLCILSVRGHLRGPHTVTCTLSLSKALGSFHSAVSHCSGGQTQDLQVCGALWQHLGRLNTIAPAALFPEHSCRHKVGQARTTSFPSWHSIPCAGMWMSG